MPFIPNTQISAVVAATDGWVDDSANTWTYVSATSFKLLGVDATVKFSKGTRLRLKQGGSYKYFVVVSSSFSTDTTVTVTAGTDYSLANSVITDNGYSYAVNPQGYPGWFSFAASYTGYASISSSLAKFKIDGEECTIRAFVTGTSNATTLTFTIPVTSPNTADFPALGVDNGLSLPGPALVEVVFNTSTANAYKDYQTASWTSSSTKSINLAFAVPL